MRRGFIDIHTHGAINIDANCASVEELLKLSDFFYDHGCDAWLPTVMTAPKEMMLEACRRVATAMRNQSRGARILGVHMEGPFLSPLFSGAMPVDQLIPGDCRFVEQLIKACDGKLLKLTLAPEIKGNYEVIKEFSKTMSISLGHSNATYEEAMKAFELGAGCITHCGNAMRLFHQHEAGLLGAALDFPCMIEIIGDGLHVAPSSVKVLVDLKGTDHVLIITDSMSAAGMGDGEFILGGQRVVVKDGDARIPEKDVRAGSVLTMDRAFTNIQKFTGLSEDETFRMFRTNQEKLLGIKL